MPHSLDARRLHAVAVTALFFLNIAAPAGADDAVPPWAREAMAQEADDLSRHAVSLGDGFLKTRLAGKPIGEPRVLESGWYLTADIGAPGYLHCWVTRGDVSPAASATGIADYLVEAAAESAGGVSMRVVNRLDAGSYDHVPWLALEWVYATGEPPDAEIALTKVRAADFGNAGVVCGHNGLGYRETFARAFETLVREAQFRDARPGQLYEAIHVFARDGQNIGVSHARYSEDEDGDIKVDIDSNYLMPVNDSTLRASDRWNISYTSPDGSVINQTVSESLDGKPYTHLSLAPVEGGSWLVSGVYKGEDLERELAGDARPLADLTQLRLMRSMLADAERDSAEFDLWMPDADPSSFVRGTIVLDGDVPGRGTVTLGPLVVTGTFDTDGSMRSGTMLTLQVARVWQRGTPP